MDIIDAHVHLYPDAIAARVTETLGGRFGNPPAFVASVAGCRERAAAAGIGLALNLPVATATGQVENANRWAQGLNRESATPGVATVRSLAALHPAGEDLVGQVERIAAMGFKGIKLHPEYQNFRFGDSGMDAVWETMAGLGLVAYLHAGGERVFKGPYRSSPWEVARLKRRFPALTVVAAHLGGFGMWDEAEARLCGTKVFMDLSHTFGWMHKTQILRMIVKHGAERVLFGTDAPWQDPVKVVEAFMRLPLSAAERQAILHDNAAGLFGF